MTDIDLPPDFPEGAILNAHVRVFQYLDAEGEMRFSVSHYGDAPLSTFVGLLEIGKLNLIQRSEEWE